MTEVRRTLSEIRATATKAARGAGCPWGLAEEAGLAARTLEAHGLPGIAALAQLFEQPRSCACDGSIEAPACGLFEMAALSDRLPFEHKQFEPIAAPLLLMAPLLQDSERGWEIDWRDGGVRRESDMYVPFGSQNPVIVDAVTIDPVPLVGKPPRPPHGSRMVPEDAWMKLEALAARTYVPETEASRAGGAGPGTSESD